MNNDRGETQTLSTTVTAFKNKAVKAFEIFTTKRDNDAKPRLNLGVVPLILSGGADAVNKRGFSSKALAVDNTSLDKMEGYMDKRCGTGSMGAWRTSFYFMINNGFLNYYRHKSELKVPAAKHQRDMPTPRGSYDLGLVRRIDLVGGGTIRLYFNSWVFKELRAPTIKAARTWVKHLQERRNWLLRQNLPPGTLPPLASAAAAEAAAPSENMTSPGFLSEEDEEEEEQYMSDDEGTPVYRREETRLNDSEIVSDKVAASEAASDETPTPCNNRLQIPTVAPLPHGDSLETHRERHHSLPNGLIDGSGIQPTDKGAGRYSIIATVLEAQNLPTVTKPNAVGKLYNKLRRNNGVAPVMNSNDSRNPNSYVCLHAGNEAFWSRVRHNTCNPIWEESFVFGISGDPSSNVFDVGDKLLISVQHTFFHRHELLHKQEFNEIGFVCLDVGDNDIELNTAIDRHVPIKKSDGETVGRLHVKIQKVARKSAKQLCSALPGILISNPHSAIRLYASIGTTSSVHLHLRPSRPRLSLPATLPPSNFACSPHCLVSLSLSLSLSLHYREISI